MEGVKEIQTKNFKKKGTRVIKRDIAVFTFFLVLSFIFWYLNSLGKEVETGIKFQVKFTNLPKERVISEDPTRELNLFLKGPGYSILKLRVSGRKAPVIIDISKVNFKKSPGSKTMNYYIVTSGLTKSLNVQMRYGCEITSIKPDTLFFTLDKIADGYSVMSDNKDGIKKRQ
jgi:hypothetical protein